jgi:tetratricopeptide (TPR) repeat protein
MDRPTTRPSVGQQTVDRPTLGAGKPESLTRPSPMPGIDRPITRPSTLPGELTRPSTLPGNVTRPSTLPGDLTRPVRPENRPAFGNQNRPGFGYDDNWATQRPVIGGQRPNNIGSFNNNNLNQVFNQTNINQTNINQTNIYNQNNYNFVNRPAWDFGYNYGYNYNRPGWGLGYNSWQNQWQTQWHNNCVNNHYNWYNGCWHGYWNSSWYSPVSYVAVGWGLNSLSNRWGYQSYQNPYFVDPVVVRSVGYDYSQPVVVNNYVTADNQGQPQQVAMSNEQQQALSTFDQGLELFRNGDYVQALSQFNNSLEKLPGDAVVHEVRGLAMFAVGNYQAAAATLNSLLASAPGMDWTTMSSLYGDPEDYTRQLRKLEDFTRSRPNDAASNFVLAYHYLVLGAKEEATSALQLVVQNQPNDVTAKRMLDALAPPAKEPAANSRLAAGDRPAEAVAAEATAAEGGEEKQTDLVGRWLAQADGTTINLTITENSQFSWKAEANNQTLMELDGNLAGDPMGIKLISAEQGTLAGMVRSQGPDAWVFQIDGSPENDPGLAFSRIQ